MQKIIQKAKDNLVYIYYFIILVIACPFIWVHWNIISNATNETPRFLVPYIVIFLIFYFFSIMDYYTRQKTRSNKVMKYMFRVVKVLGYSLLLIFVFIDGLYKLHGLPSEESTFAIISFTVLIACDRVLSNISSK